MPLLKPTGTGMDVCRANVQTDSVTLKVICNEFLVVKVNCWSYVFNIIKSI